MSAVTKISCAFFCCLDVENRNVAAAACHYRLYLFMRVGGNVTDTVIRMILPPKFLRSGECLEHGIGAVV